MYLKKDLVMDKKKIGIIVGAIALIVATIFGYKTSQTDTATPTADTTAVVTDSLKSDTSVTDTTVTDTTVVDTAKADTAKVDTVAKK